jgi:hypothetical protein
MSDTDGNESASQAWIRGDMQKAQELNQPIVDDQPAGSGVPDSRPGAYVPDPRIDAQEAQAAPSAETAFFERSATKLAEQGPEGQALVQKWGGSASSPLYQQNMMNARKGFSYIATNRPDLVEKFDVSGMGNDVGIIEHLAEFWLMKANMMGEDDSMSQRYSAPSEAPAFRGGGGSKAALLAELSQIRKDNPVGTEKYKNPAVQRRITQINETLYPGDIVGRGGRTA